MKQKKCTAAIRLNDDKTYQVCIFWGRKGQYNHLSTVNYSSINWAVASLRKYTRLLGLSYDMITYVGNSLDRYENTEGGQKT